MASLMMHMAIGELFCKKQSVDNNEEFLKGNLYPDLCVDKEAAHGVSGLKKPEHFDDAIKKRVNLNRCCETLDLTNVFDRGCFLHLLSDYYFYNEYVLKLETYNSVSDRVYEKMNKIVYGEYARVSSILLKEFPYVGQDLIPEFARVVDDSDMILFSKSGILNLVNKCSLFDLDETFRNIKNGVKNFMVFVDGVKDEI